MPRANRHYIPGCIWHITHRCHKKEFLLKFARDRRRWIGLLYEARKRFGLTVLNYVVTSNHIHLLVVDDGAPGAIPKSMQLVAGRTGQEYNRRKARKGAFWEDRYHATAVESDRHLAQCMVYIDMNMVRAGVVRHPQEWPFGGYHEVLHPRERYGIIDWGRLCALLNIQDNETLKESRNAWIAEALASKNHRREDRWTASIAVGSKAFVDHTGRLLGISVKRSSKREEEGSFALREPDKSYSIGFGTQIDPLRGENGYFWKGIG